MKRCFLILLSLLLATVSLLADTSQPIVEIRADRTVIYPQRMELTGEETLMDVLQMVPELLIGGYEEVLNSYNLRIDNCPMDADTRLVVSQMKAKDIEMIQVCDNTGVAKGTIGMGRVLDVNMKMPEKWKGFVEGQGDFGKDRAGFGTVNALYGSKGTDLYANASYRRQYSQNEEHLTLHMTNRFDDRNKLLSYVTQQYMGYPSSTTHKVMGRARYFHTFNNLGTELLIVGGYQYSCDPILTNTMPLYTLELNTPFLTKRLSLMLGVEGDFLMARQKDADKGWNVFNHDVYLQLTYALPKWNFTIGNRVMFYNYKLFGKQSGKETSQTYSDTRNNTNACIIFQPDNRNQIQLGYYRKYYNPTYFVLFMDNKTLYDEKWLRAMEVLDEWTINQVKLAYAYSKQKLTVQAEASYYAIEEGDNLTELGASAYWKTKGMSLAGGPNLYVDKSGVYASFRLAPTAFLPHAWQIGLQVVYYTRNTPQREISGVPVYGCLSVNKQLGRHWNLGLDWHDMFDAVSSVTLINRHAANIKVQYRF